MTPADAGQLSDLSTATLIKTVPQICRISHSRSASYTVSYRDHFLAQPPVVLCLKPFLIVQIWQKYVDPCLCLEIVSHESYFCHIPAGVSLAAGEPRTPWPALSAQATPCTPVSNGRCGKAIWQNAGSGWQRRVGRGRVAGLGQAAPRPVGAPACATLRAKMLIRCLTAGFRLNINSVFDISKDVILTFV